MQSHWHFLQVTATALSGLFFPLANNPRAQEPQQPAPQIKVIQVQEGGPKVRVLQPQLKLKPQPIQLKAVQKNEAVTGKGKVDEKKIQLQWHVQSDNPANQIPTPPKVKVMAKAMWIDENGNVTELDGGELPSGELHVPRGDQPHVIMLHINEGITEHAQTLGLHELDTHAYEIYTHNENEHSFQHAATPFSPKTALRPRPFRRTPRRVTRNAEIQRHGAHWVPAGTPPSIEYEVEIEKEAAGDERQIRLHIEGKEGQAQVLKLQSGSAKPEAQIFRIHADPAVEIERAAPAHPPQKILIHKEGQEGPVEIELIELGEAGAADDVILLKGAEADVQKAQRMVERVQAQATDRVLRHEMIEVIGAPDKAHAAPAELKQMIEKLNARIAELEKKVAELERQK